MTLPTDTPYIGRFAPSPTGPLHIGSLLTAVASYVDAKANNGQWLVRMEDLDPPRESIEAAHSILQSLLAHGLQWDDEVLYQSQRHSHYQQVIDQLLKQQLAYRCRCSRKQLPANNIYPGYCRQQHVSAVLPHSIRITTNDKGISFKDPIQGFFQQQLNTDVGDFIVLRKDALFAYQLAVVIDDAYQNITKVIRGSDLLDNTPRQIYLQQVLHYPLPSYLHLPVINNEREQKLSKQHGAQAIDDNLATENLFYCLTALGQTPPETLRHSSSSVILQWAIKHWKIDSIPHQLSIQQ